ncbi:MAG: SMP-30/gluconolactonase/LRE family protein [Alphaproteobacteria bacterium]|nr:SMP-30/gluconolactonase/LRE family protein [Alphaproteobacteria bacterium]
MGGFTHMLRDLEQIFFPNRDQHPIPAMDGAFTPNDLLDSCHPVGAPIPGADAVARGPDGAIYVSAGPDVLRLSGPGFADRSVFATIGEGAVGALTFHRDGRLLVCVAGRGLVAIGADGSRRWLEAAVGQALGCLTDVVVGQDGTIFLADGSRRNAPSDWLRDLMENGSSGRLLACGPALDNARVLLDGLRYPHGLALSGDGGMLWFTESWNHRLSRAPVTGLAIGRPQSVIGNMPGYPARLAPASGGGFWLSLFAVRTHLVEFVLREDEYREEMMRTVPQHLWLGPALATSGDCHEPMQFGNIKALGIEKPWAPPRSYGLVARIDADGEPVRSLHSRRGGRHHGITATAETEEGLVIVSKGSGRVLLGVAEGGS